MNHQNRGIAIIINVLNFMGKNNAKLKRKGSENDVRRLKKVLKTLNFEIHLLEDKKKSEIKAKIKSSELKAQKNVFLG